MDMRRREFLSSAAAPLFAAPESVPPLIPLPKSFRRLPGTFPRDLANRPRIVREDPKTPAASPEAYRLSATRDGVTLIGRTDAAIAMARRTLAQLVEAGASCCEVNDWPDFPLRGAHLCYHLIREGLAYNCPNFAALLEHIDQLAALKYNAVLLELEAMFPYRRHPAIPARIAFTREQIAAIRDRIAGNGMEIIPIFQCLGHAYGVLWHDEYAAYREVPGTCQQYCPTNPKVADLYMEFVDEYLELFPGIREWHIGGDESRQLAKCPRCKAKADKLGVSRLYVDHVAEIVRRLHARGLRPVMWSDMLEHYPEALETVPRYVRIAYWNYDLPNWPRPYAVDMFRRAGFDVLSCPGVRFNATGTELSVYYPEALRGIETLVPRSQADGASGVLVTNWMKGSPHENTHYGFAYAADRCWNAGGTRADFQKRYAGLAYGAPDASICEVYDLLSVKVPYAEPVQLHMPDPLDRFNLSGLRFPEKWKRYSDPRNEPKVIEQLTRALDAARSASVKLRQIAPACTRGKRQFELLQLSAECIEAKARLGLALHGRVPVNADLLRAWVDAKRKHRALLEPTGFTRCVEFLNELMFEPAEYEAAAAKMRS